MTLHGLVLASIAALLTVGPAWSQPGADAFDGVWDVHLQCDDARDRAGAVVKGYVFDFPAEVRAGKLRGQFGDAGQPSSLTLTGTIGPDGEAFLDANGFSGKPDYTFGHMQPASPYRYTMRGRFDARGGHAQRVELRRCIAEFARRG